MITPLIHDLLIVLAAGLTAGLICRRLRVSVLVGYLVVGALVGEGSLGWVRDDGHEIEHLAEAGVFLLLFSIGLEFSLEELGRLGRNLLVGGSLQMLLVAVPIMGVLLVADLSWKPAALIAAAASFSSTVLVFKTLSEWGHSSLSHGRRAIGILLFQDAALIPLLLLVPLLTDSGQAPTASDYLLLLLTSILFVVAIGGLRYSLANWVIPLFTRYRSPDVVILFTLVALGTITLLAHTIGLPPAIGAFAAGLIFNGNRWSGQIDALIMPFRETFSAIFFVSLGLLFEPRLLWNEPWLMLSCFLGLLIIKAAAATIALKLTGLNWKSAAGMGIGLAHIGEFAFVLVLLGWKTGLLAETDYQRIIVLAIGSLTLTPLLLSTGLWWARPDAEAAELPLESAHQRSYTGRQAVVIGAGPIGRQVASRLETVGNDVCIVDLSPINLQQYAQEGFRTVAGDATQDATLAHAAAAHASLVVVSVPNDRTALQVVRRLRELNERAFVLVRCRYQANAPALERLGANHVVAEEALAGSALLKILTQLDENAAG